MTETIPVWSVCKMEGDDRDWVYKGPLKAPYHLVELALSPEDRERARREMAPRFRCAYMDDLSFAGHIRDLDSEEPMPDGMLGGGEKDETDW